MVNTNEGGEPSTSASLARAVAPGTLSGRPRSATGLGGMAVACVLARRMIAWDTCERSGASFECPYPAWSVIRDLEYNFASESRQWARQGVLPLTATKRLLGASTCPGPSGGCTRCYGRRASATRLPPRHRPLHHYLDWRHQPEAEFGHCISKQSLARRAGFERLGLLALSATTCRSLKSA